MLDHERHMGQAIALAAGAPGAPFGSVIIHRESGETLAEGRNRAASNPIWHGEMDALEALFRSGGKVDGRRLVLYTTAEPCPMCMAAILWSGIRTAVFGTSIPFLQANGWEQIDLRAEEVLRRAPSWECTLVGGVLEQECNALFAARRNRSPAGPSLGGSRPRSP